MVKGFTDKDGKFRPTGNGSNDKVNPTHNDKPKNPDFNKIKDERKTFGLASDVTSFLKNELGNDVNVNNVKDGYSNHQDKIIEMDDGSEWVLYKNYDAMIKHAEESVRQDLEDDPEMFNQDFIQSHQSISETDARLFGNDFGDMMVEDRELDELKDMADQFSIDYDDEMDDDKLKNKLIDDVSYARSKEVEKTIKNDGLKSFICDDEGLCSDDEFQEQYGKWLSLDVDSAVDDAINQDGAEHFVSRYDGDSHTMKNGQVLVREN